jgi:hypothetical protein
LHQGFVKYVAISEFKQFNIPPQCIHFISVHRRLAEFEDNRDERAHPEELAVLRMEANTWGLLQALIP